MELAYEYPALAQLSCADCKKWIYQIPSGEAMLDDDNQRVPRPKSSPTPCEDCPKESPEQEHLYRLSWKNHKTVQLHKRVKSGVWKLPERLESDPLLADNFAIIDAISERAKAREQSRRLADAVLIALSRLRSG